MASNRPKHGDAIIEVKESAFGKKLVASFQFQRFLDELGSDADGSDDESSQIIASLALKNGALSAKVSNQALLVDDLVQLLSDLTLKNAGLEAKVANQQLFINDLEQVSYVNKG